MATQGGGTVALGPYVLAAFVSWALALCGCAREELPLAGARAGSMASPIAKTVPLQVQVLAEALTESRSPALASCGLPGCVDREALSAVAGAELRWLGAEAEIGPTLLSSATGWIELILPIGGAWVEIHAAGYATRRLELGSESTADGRLEVVLEPIRSRVVLVSAQGGGPLEAAQVDVTLADGGSMAGQTDRAGRLVFEHLPAPAVRVRVSANGYEPADLQPAGGLDAGPWVAVLQAQGRLEVLVVGIDGRPSPGAEVRLRHDSDLEPRSVRTDRLGWVRLSELPLGSFDLRAEQGLAVSRVRLGVAVRGPQPQQVRLQLRPALRLPVRVVAAAELEAPVAGAELRLVEGGLGPFALVSSSDDRGMATLGPFLHAGAQLSVRARGFVPRLAEAVPPASAEPWVLSLLRGGRVWGYVVGPEGEPVADARFEVLGDDLFGRPLSLTHQGQELGPAWQRMPSTGNLGVVALPGSDGSASGAATPLRSDAAGRFEFVELPPGRLRLRVRHRGFLDRVGKAFTLEPGGAVRRRVQLTRGHRARGRVLDGSGAPVAGARVEARGALVSGRRVTRTDLSGGFVLTALPQAVQLLVASPDDPTRTVVRRDVRLQASDGTVPEEFELRLPERRSATRVCVFDSDGQAVSGARLVLNSLDPGSPLRESSSTAVDGCAVAAAVGLKLRVEVSAPGFRPKNVEWQAVSTGLALRLEPGWVLAGRVTQVRGRQPLPGARVSAVQGGRRHAAVADAHGEYRLSDLGSLPFELRASHPDHVASSMLLWPEDLPQEAGRLLAPALNLQPGAVVFGRVEWPDGRPVPGARVGLGPRPPLRPIHSEVPGWVTSDARGRFRLGQLAPGEKDIYAVAQGRGQATLFGHPVATDRSSVGVLLLLSDETLGNWESPTEPNLAVELEQVGPAMQLSYVAPGSEAERAGLVAGQRLLRVDGRAPQGVREARQALSGPEGSDVLVELDDGRETWRVPVRRESVTR